MCWQECEQQAEENGCFPPHLDYCVQFGPCQYKRDVENWAEVSGGPQDDFGAGVEGREGEAETAGFDQA